MNVENYKLPSFKCSHDLFVSDIFPLKVNPPKKAIFHHLQPISFCLVTTSDIISLQYNIYFIHLERQLLLIDGNIMFLLYLIILNIYEFTMRKTIIHETDENASMDLLGRPQSNGPPMAQNEDPKLTLPTYRDDPSVSNRK